MELKKIVRHTLPTKFDNAPYGTICQVKHDEDSSSLFIQISPCDDALWEPIGSIMEKAFEEFLEDQHFIEQLIHLVTTLNEKDFDTIGRILISYKEYE